MGSNSREGSMLMPGLGIRISNITDLRFWFGNYFGNASANALTALYAASVAPGPSPPSHHW